MLVLPLQASHDSLNLGDSWKTRLVRVIGIREGHSMSRMTHRRSSAGQHGGASVTPLLCDAFGHYATQLHCGLPKIAEHCGRTCLFATSFEPNMPGHLRSADLGTGLTYYPTSGPEVPSRTAPHLTSTCKALACHFPYAAYLQQAFRGHPFRPAF